MRTPPGTVSEQTVDADYLTATVGDPAGCPALTEEQLIATYPDVFANYRRSNFRVESLPGNPMPEFALPTLIGERYSRLATDRFASPTLIVVLDPEGASPGSLSTPCARGGTASLCSRHNMGVH